MKTRRIQAVHGDDGGAESDNDGDIWNLRVIFGEALKLASKKQTATKMVPYVPHD